jgi:hypothetical protein
MREELILSIAEVGQLAPETPHVVLVATPPTLSRLLPSGSHRCRSLFIVRALLSRRIYSEVRPAPFTKRIVNEHTSLFERSCVRASMPPLPQTCPAIGDRPVGSLPPEWHDAPTCSKNQARII